MPWNLFSAPLQTSSDPLVERVLGLFCDIQRRGLLLSSLVGIEPQEGGAEQELLHLEDLDLSSSSSSPSSSDSSTDSESSSSSSTSDSSREGSIRAEGEENWADGDHGSGDEDGLGRQLGNVRGAGGEEQMEVARSVDAGDGPEDGRMGGGGDVEGGAPTGQAEVLVKVVHQQSSRFIPGWILRGRTRSGLKSRRGLKSISKAREIRSYPVFLARRQL